MIFPKATKGKPQKRISPEQQRVLKKMIRMKVFFQIFIHVYLKIRDEDLILHEFGEIWWRMLIAKVPILPRNIAGVLRFWNFFEMIFIVCLALGSILGTSSWFRMTRFSVFAVKWDWYYVASNKLTSTRTDFNPILNNFNLNLSLPQNQIKPQNQNGLICS